MMYNSMIEYITFSLDDLNDNNVPHWISFTRFLVRLPGRAVEEHGKNGEKKSGNAKAKGKSFM